MAKVLLYELGKSISFGRLPLLGKVLWPMLLAASDNQGRGLAEADVIKWTACANVNELTPDNIPDLLGEIAQQDMIHLYADSRGRSLYQVIKWWEYQDLQWAQPSKFEPPAGWVDRVRCQRKDVQTTQNWDKVGGFLDNGGGNTRPGAKEIPPASPAGTPAGTPPTDQAGVPKQTNSKQTKPTQSNSTTTTEEAVAAAVSNLLAFGCDQANVDKQSKSWKRPELAGPLIEYAKTQEGLTNPQGWVMSKMGKGEPPPKQPKKGNGRDRPRSVDGKYAEFIES